MPSTLSQLIIQPKIGYSVEIYPPKTQEGVIKLKEILKHIVTIVPNFPPTFIDVTYCAGGGDGQQNRDATLSLCQWIQNELHIMACAHLVLRGLTPDQIQQFIADASARGIQCIMALRGDNNKNGETSHASDLVSIIRQYEEKKFNILVAAYPEGHPDCHGNLAEDITHLRHKVACGADAVITQFFLDTDKFLSFRDQLTIAGGLGHTPLIPGIILLSTLTGLWRMIHMTEDSITIPPLLLDNIHSLEMLNDKDAIREWGLQTACQLCRDLHVHGERFFHIYTLNADETTCQLIQFIHKLDENL
jgi:methylenetetrahydrofolate reductase (NADPH)